MSEFMKVYELIELLKEKPQELEVYLQDCEHPRFPGDRVLSMCNLDKSNVSIMQNGDVKYLAIGCTVDGIARADGSKVVNIDWMCLGNEGTLYK